MCVFEIRSLSVIRCLFGNTEWTLTAWLEVEEDGGDRLNAPWDF